MRTIRTPEHEEAFLSALASCGNVSSACATTGIGRTSVYQWRDDDPAFAAAWEKAQNLGTDALEDEATRRASEGTLEPVFYQGSECGQIRKYSDTLMIFLLKARRPEKFKERSEVVASGPNGGPLVQIYLPGNTRDET